MKFYERQPVVLDLETTNLDYGSALNRDNKLLMAVFNDGTQRYKIGNEYQHQNMVQLIEDRGFFVAHNAKFELQWLKRMGLDLLKVQVWDTMLAEYVIHGNSRVPLGLGDTAKRYGLSGKEPYVDLCMKGKVSPEDLPESMVLARCNYDVNVTKEIYLKQLAYMREHGLLKVMFTRCMLTPVLADIEDIGMKLDSERVDKVYFDAVNKVNELSAKLDTATGGINTNSSKQLGEFLYDELKFSEAKDRRGNPVRTAAGARKTDSATIASLKPKNKKQREFLSLVTEHNKCNSALSKALNKYKQCADADDLLKAVFNQSVTRTHRLSSTGSKYSIQFQNQAREHKPLFCPRSPGWEMCEIDGAQLEFRVAAYLGQDQQATEDIRNGVDVHQFTADTITAAGQETDRQTAKAHTFKPLYGGTSGTKAEVAYYEAFKEKYKGIAEAQQAWIDEVLSTGSLLTCTGLRFFWPDTKIQRSGFVTNSQSICNYPVQSLATADIIPIALTYFWREVRKRNLRTLIVNTVHDSIILEVPPEEKDEIRQIGIDSFTTNVYAYLKRVYNIDFNVPLGVGIKFGSHWSEGHEEKLNIEPS